MSVSLDLPQLQRERQPGQGLLPTGCSEAQGTLSSVVRVWSVLCGQLTALAETPTFTG